MHSVIIHNLTRPLLSPLRVRYCASFVCRLRGLTFRRQLATNDGLLLVQKRENRTDAAIHMLFVWINLAVVWVNADHEIVDVRLAHRWRPFYMPQKPARFVLEASAERLPEFQVGDRLRFEKTNVG